MTKQEKKAVNNLVKRVRGVIRWPPKSYDRRDDEGYPTEIAYDEYAYKRLVDTYREALTKILADYAAEIKQ
jgi:hypothetical protein